MDHGPLQLVTPTWSTPDDRARPTSADAVESIRHHIAAHRLERALALADDAVRAWPDDETVLLVAAGLARRIGRHLAAHQLLHHAEQLGSEQAATQRRVLINEAVPYWHFRMMNDEVRNRAYDQALRRHVGPDSLVLDIGCGAGLLSMMAARAGAEHVYACELSELMAHQARGVIADNGYARKVTVVNKLSNRLQVGVDLPRKADIIVAEVFDTGLLGEQALRTFAHAREHLLRPGGRLLPARARVHALLIESDLLHKEVIASRCCGFDVRALNGFSPPYFQARLDAFPHRRLSDPFPVSDYDFLQAPQAHDGAGRLEVEATRSGTCHGVCFWFSLHFDQDIAMSTGPENRWNCWMQAISTFETPAALSAGERVALHCHQSGDRILRFELTSR